MEETDNCLPLTLSLSLSLSLSLALSDKLTHSFFFSLSPSFSRIVPNLHPLLSPSPRYLSFAKIFWLGFGLGNASNVTRRLSRLGLRKVDIGVTDRNIYL